jgi:hypothetical protein
MNDDATIRPRTIQISLWGRTGGGRNHWNSQQRRHMLRHMSQERRRTHIEAYDLREKIHLSFMNQVRRHMLRHMSQERRRTHIEAYDLREKIHLSFMSQVRRHMLRHMSPERRPTLLRHMI